MKKAIKRLLCQFTAKISTSNINEVKGGIIPVEDPSVPKARSDDNIKRDLLKVMLFYPMKILLSQL